MADIEGVKLLCFETAEHKMSFSEVLPNQTISIVVETAIPERDATDIFVEFRMNKDQMELLYEYLNKTLNKIEGA